MVDRTYEGALEELNELLKLQRDFILPPLHVRMDMQRAYLRASGCTLDDLDKLNIVHVAGSKGKGSTCAYIESIFRHEGYCTGLITSPHLINVEERIRVNGNPVGRDVFAEHFWLLYDKFRVNAEMFEEFPEPSYLSFILHMAFNIFVSKKVEVVVVEVGLGGRYDHTNVVNLPRVTVVCSIELEHTDILGDTIQEVAWNKAGIFKSGVAAVVAADEPEDAMAVFVKEAEEVECPLFVAPRFADVQGGLDGDEVVLEDWRRLVGSLGSVMVHERNVCLALAAVSLWHGHHNVIPSSAPRNASSHPRGVPTLALCPTRKQIDGIASTRVAGRFHEVRMSERLIFFIDCAHTVESIEHCSNWFQTVSVAQPSDAGHRAFRILLFTVTGSRNPLVMLRRLETLSFDVVYFAGSVAGKLARVGPKLPCPCDCKAVWEGLASPTPSYELVGDQLIHFLRSLKAWDGISPLTLNSGNVRPRMIHVLVTGSVYLAGDVLSALRPEYSIAWT